MRHPAERIRSGDPYHDAEPATLSAAGRRSDRHAPLYGSSVRKLAGVALIFTLAAGCGGAERQDGAGGTKRETENAMEVRKQVYELTSQDLGQFPVWEFALDEEGEAGQDEATVKPRPDLDAGVDPDEGLFVVRAEFTAADGSIFDGFVTPDLNGDLGGIQPSVVTSEGHVSFWFGMVEPELQAIERSYSMLGVERSELFPMTFRTAVPVSGAPMEGKVPGFLYLDESGEAREVS